MNRLKRGLWLISLLLAITARLALAQVPTTTVQDTVYSANGTPAAGTVLVSWGAFTTANGQAVPAGTTSATIGTGGVLTMALAPNAGSTPMGSYYTAVFHLSDGTTSRGYWVVPIAVPGGGPAKLATVQSQVLPTSVAMQTVSKQYVDQAIAAAQFGSPQAAGSPYVLITGDTMTGPLVLPADPVSPMQAADKNYVDENIAAVTGGVGQKVSELPVATQVVAQPSGTQLDVNLLNGELYASQFVTGQGSNGINNALASPDCANGCKVIVEPTYTGTDSVKPGNTLNGVVIVDQRGGTNALTAINPQQPDVTSSTAYSIAQTESISTPQLEAERPGALGIGSDTLSLSTYAPAGGNNLFPSNIESVPYFKSTYSVLSMTGTYNTQGQHIQANDSIHCYAVGDCLAGGQDIVSSGGYRDVGDEGSHPFDLQVREDFNVFQGVCAGGCTTGATQLAVSVTSSQGSQGDGRFLIDKNPAKDLSTGTIVSGGKTIFGTVAFTGTNFPVSVFLTLAQSATSQPTNMAPGNVTLPIATSGVTAGFATNTAALPATTGIACVADVETGVPLPNFETAAYTVVDATHIQLALNKPHLAGSTIAVGGLCGYGLEQQVDTIGAVKQVFPVIGSTDATDLYYADANTNVVGVSPGSGSTAAYLNETLHIASISRTGNVVTVNTVEGTYYVNGLTMTVSGVADPSYNGTFTVSTILQNTLTYNSSGANSTSSGGTLSIVTGGFALYPMAEVLTVLNPSDKLVDGSFTLAANTVPWANGDPVEEPHYYQELVDADTEFITQFAPRPRQYSSAGKSYGGNVTAGLRGWAVTNTDAASNYLGAGGTHSLPDDAFLVSGPWHSDFEVDAGTAALLYVHCNIKGCNRWDSNYDLFSLDSAVGGDALNYDPQSSTSTWTLRGAQYSFSPSAFTAGTINVGTLNATTINGGVSGGAITSGTVSAARLPLFGPSGTTHAPGIVPDPGATAGATRFLREDGTWNVPAGAGSSGPTPGNFTTGTFTGSVNFIGTYPADSGNGNPTLDWGEYYGNADLLMYDAGPGVRFGWGLRGNEMQFFELTNSHYSFNGCGDFQLTGVCEVMRLNSANGTLSLGNSGVYSFTNGTNSSATVDTGISRDAAGVFDFGNGTPGNTTGTLKAAQYVGPATAPSGSCSTTGAWVFSQDGHATFCASGTWATKI